jgi:hypothetical protein
MSDSDLAASSFISESEAFETLEQLAGRRTLPIPADTLVRHTLALPGPWDWPVRRAAFEALLRRLASARSQELSVIDSPGRGPFGRYTLGSPQAAGSLPYDVRLFSCNPIDACCNCADFLRSSLGVCKAGWCWPTTWVWERPRRPSWRRLHSLKPGWPSAVC